MPRLKEIFHLNVDEYANRMRTLATEEIRHEEREQRRECIGSGASIGISVAAAPFTAGMSLAGGVYAGRTWDIARQKLYILHRELHNRGELPFPETGRDFWIPVGTHFAGSVAGGSLGYGFEHIVGPMVTPGLGASSLATSVAHQPMQQSLSSAFHGAAAGVQHVAQGVGAAFQGHAGTAAYYAQGPAYEAGARASEEACRFGFDHASQHGIQYATRTGASTFDPKHPNTQTSDPSQQWQGNAPHPGYSPYPPPSQQQPYPPPYPPPYGYAPQGYGYNGPPAGYNAPYPIGYYHPHPANYGPPPY